MICRGCEEDKPEESFPMRKTLELLYSWMKQHKGDRDE